MKVYESRLYTLRLPFNMERDKMPDYDGVQEILRRAVETYKEFGHVNHDVPEDEEQIVNAWLNTRNYCGVSVYKHEPSTVYDAWHTSIERQCEGIISRDVAEQKGYILSVMMYDYERDMGCPIKTVEHKIIEDSDGTFKILLTPKYDTF